MWVISLTHQVDPQTPWSHLHLLKALKTKTIILMYYFKYFKEHYFGQY